MIGRGGIRDSKVEGDGSTPSGAFNLHHAYFRPDRVGAAHFAIKCVPIRNWQIWCDDPRRADYNKLLDRRSGCEFSHERLAGPTSSTICSSWSDTIGRIPFRTGGLRYSSTLGGARAIRLQDALLSMRSDLDWIIRRLSYRSRLIVLPEMRLSPHRRSFFVQQPTSTAVNSTDS